MKEEKLFRAIGQIDGDLIEEAASGRYRIRKWRKYIGIAASILLVVAASIVGRMTEKKDYENAQITEIEIVGEETEKNVLNFTIAFGGMGYEGIMGYEMLKIEKPWKETDEIEILPIIENTSIYHVERYPEDVAIGEERYVEMEAWALEVAAFLGMEAYTEDRNIENVIVENEAIKIKVDGDMQMRIEFLMPLALSAEYDTTTEATMEETYALAEYILAEYGGIFDLENPQIAVSESDYDFYGERYHHSVRFYSKGASVEETIVNYYFDYADFHLDEEGKLWFVDITHKDKKSLGEYKVISLERATEELLAGNYATSYYGDTVPTKEYIRDVELAYYMSFVDDYKPYYKFWVEVPAEKRENGLNTYVAYYVPAIEGAYLEVSFN